MNSNVAVILLGLAFAALAPAAVTINIINNDGAGVGFNDPTVVAPVGGNTGTTLGQQRLNVFQAAANIWGATLTSVPAIRVRAQWTALTCNATGAVLGSAGALQAFQNGAGMEPGYQYGGALTNKLSGFDVDPATPEINANFNVNLGQSGCLTGTFFYLGLDANQGSNVNLLVVLLHELGHGLGFQTFTNGSTGAFFAGLPTIFDRFLLDSTVSKTWDVMTPAERVASAINNQRLVWNGPNVTGSTSTVLTAAARAVVSAPASVAASYQASASASFGPAITVTGLTGEVMPVVDQADGTGLACNALSGLNAAAVNGKIALIDRGTCSFVIKVKNAQNAGAIGVLIANNTTGLPGMGGTDATITIPTLGILQSDANLLKVALRTRSRTRSGMFVSLLRDPSLLSGADTSGRMRMYAPNPFQGGSSVSHFDVSAFRNQLMEPAINSDLTLSVVVPQDLTFQLFKDLGWN